MIKVNKVSKDYCYGEIRGAWDDLMDEYKAITDYFLQHHFVEFMAAIDKWEADNKQ